jgi:hypothetical protein
MLTLRIHPRAEMEMADVAAGYEFSRPGHGRLFLGDVDHAVALMLTAPKLYQAVTSDLRRAVLRRFPYNLYYLDQPDEQAVYLVGCLSGRTDPSGIVAELTNRASAVQTVDPSD